MSDDAKIELAAHWIRTEIQALSAYQVPDAAGLTKLDAMENPYVWPSALRDEWAARVKAVDVNRYPDPAASGLAAQLREVMGIPADMGLLFGNGSDELIQIMALALAGPGRSLLSVEPGFAMYRMIATFCGMHYVGVPLRAKDFTLDRDAVLEAMERHEPAVLFLACPNNPTGNLFDAADVEAIIAAAPGLVVIDEAYAPFTDTTYLGRIGAFDNLVVLRTVSKMGLAGLRLGYLVGPKPWLDEFDKVRLPYNINVLTQVATAFALEHMDVFTAQTAEIRVERGRLFEALDAIRGVTPFPSEANFILFRLDAADAVFEGLKSRGVLVKNLCHAHPSLNGCLRVTVGTRDENESFLDALRGSMSQ